MKLLAGSSVCFRRGHKEPAYPLVAITTSWALTEAPVERVANHLPLLRSSDVTPVPPCIAAPAFWAARTKPLAKPRG
ncbi:hypothetical protein CS8_024170 [Cupriavidus sp. 8B]